MTTPRRLFITARGAGDLKEAASWVPGTNTPYLRLELLPMGTVVKTGPDETNPANPIWDETFELQLPPATPDEELTLRVAVMDAKALLPDTAIGSGSFVLGSLLRGTGAEEARIPIHGSGGGEAGIVYLGLRFEKGEAPPAASTAGQVLGTVHAVPTGGASIAVGPEVLPSAETTPTTANAGGLAPGQIQDPSAPGYGVVL